MGASDHPLVLGVLAGGDMPDRQLAAWASSAQVLLAADGGADRLKAMGRVPSATVGDLDSISPETAELQNQLLRIDDQNSSDCDKLLALAASLGYSEITLAGVEGDLLDHVLGTVLSAARAKSLVRLALRRGVAFVLSGPFDRVFEALPGKRFSVIPIDMCEGVFLTGTRWRLADDILTPLGLTSLSNIAESSRVHLSVRSGNVLVFIETDGSPNWHTTDLLTPT